MFTLSPHSVHRNTPTTTECRLSSNATATRPAAGSITSTYTIPLLSPSAPNITVKPLQDRQPGHHTSPPYLSKTEPDTGYSASHVYADCIGTPGNHDAPNDLVPEILARLPGKDTLLQSRPLVVQRGDVARRYAVDTPPGGQKLENIDWSALKSEGAIHVCLNKEEKGDSLYRKIIAAAQNTFPPEITQEDVNQLRNTVAEFVRQNPGLAEQANQALENDTFFSLPVDQAIEAYKNTLHTDHPAFTPRPARPWLEPLIQLLTGAMPMIHNAIRGEPLLGPLPKTKATAIELRNPTVVNEFRHFINNHHNLDHFIATLEQGLQAAEKEGAPTDTPGIQEGWKMYRQLTDILETSATLTEEGSERVLDFVAQYAEVVPVDAGSVPSTAPPGEPGVFSWMKQGVVNLWNSARDPLPLFPGAEGMPVLSEDESETSRTFDSPCGPIEVDRMCDGRTDCEAKAEDNFYWDESLAAIPALPNEFRHSACPNPVIRTLLRLGNTGFCEKLYKCWPMAESPDCYIVNDLTSLTDIPKYCKNTNQEFPFERWLCQDNSQYIAASQLCDAIPHCNDGSDEINGGCCSQEVNDRFRVLANERATPPPPDTNNFIHILKERFTADPVSEITLLSSLLNHPPEAGDSVTINGVTYTHFKYLGLWPRMMNEEQIKNRQFTILFSHGAPYKPPRGDNPEAYIRHHVTVQLDMENMNHDALNKMWHKSDFSRLASQLGYEGFDWNAPPSLETATAPTTTEPTTATPSPSTAVPAYCQDNVDIVSWHSYCELPASVRKIPGNCQDYRHNIADNHPISSALRQVLNGITDYHIDLLKTVRKELKATPEAKSYSDDELHSLLHSFHQHSTRAKKSVTLRPQHVLSGCLDVLQNSPPASDHKNAIRQLPFTTPFWVKRSTVHPPQLIQYTLDEVLSGALSGYDPLQLILPPELEPFRLFMSAENFSDVLHGAYLEGCQVPSIAMNQAPRALLDQCGHLQSSLQDNPFMINNVNEIVASIIEYHPELNAMAFQQLRLKSGTNIFSDEQLASIEDQFNRLATKIKAQAAAERADQINELSPEILSDYLRVLQNIATADPETTPAPYVRCKLQTPSPSAPPSAPPTEPPFTLSTKLWYKTVDEETGLILAIPYTVEELFKGYIIGHNPQNFILPPILEPILSSLVDEGLTEILHHTLTLQLERKLHNLVSKKMSPILYPNYWIVDTYNDIKSTTPLACETDWGLVDRPLVAYWYAGKLYGHATPYELMFNSYGYTSESLALDYACPFDLCDPGVRELADRLIKTDMYKAIKNVRDDISDDDLSTFSQLIDFNRNHRHPYYGKANAPSYNETAIIIGTSDSYLEARYDDSISDGETALHWITRIMQPFTFYPTQNQLRSVMNDVVGDSDANNPPPDFNTTITGMERNPFVTAIWEWEDVTVQGKTTREKQITLFSYLSGKTRKVGAALAFLSDLQNHESLTYKWMSLNGGDFILDHLKETPRSESIFIDIDNMDKYVNSIKEVTPVLAYNTVRWIDIQQTSYGEAAANIGLDVLEGLVMLASVIPEVGDLIMIEGDMLISELRIALEDDPDRIKELRREQLMTAGIDCAVSLLPVIGEPIGKIVEKAAQKLLTTETGKVVAKAVSKIGSKSIAKFDSLITHDIRAAQKAVTKSETELLGKTEHFIPENGITREEMTDGLPNRRLDVDGNPKRAVVERGSKDWKIRCGGGRVKRQPPPIRSLWTSCATPEIQDEVYRSEYLSFATRKGEQKPSFYFTHPDYGDGRLRLENKMEGPLITRIYRNTHHTFFNDKQMLTSFSEHFEALPKENQTVDNYLRLGRVYGGSDIPTEGAYHHEAFFEGANKASKCSSLHYSGGTVLSSTQVEKFRSSIPSIYQSMKNSQPTPDLPWR